MKLTNFHIEPELLAGLKAVKERDGIGQSEQIRRAIRLWLKTKRIKVTTRRPGQKPRSR